jgi:hypothetical protein
MGADSVSTQTGIGVLCIGGCGREAEDGEICRSCWNRVPIDLRLLLNSADADEEWYADKAAAELRAEIRRWLRAHPG